MGALRDERRYSISNSHFRLLFLLGLGAVDG